MRRKDGQGESIAICSTFPGDGIPRVLRFWLAELGLDWETNLAPFNQVFQQLLDPQSLIGQNRAGINLVAVRLELGLAEELKQAIDLFLSRSRLPLILVFVPGGNVEDEALFRDSDDKLTIVRSAAFAETFGAREWELRSADLEAISYNGDFFTAFGYLVARKIHALSAPVRKAIVLDCDETLWKGVCAEDSEVVPQRDVQAFVLEQRRAGMLLCLNSKNREEDVLRALGQNSVRLVETSMNGAPHSVSPPKEEGTRKEGALHADDFAAMRINWQSKSENLWSIAQELQIAPETIIFIDDNPLECAEVEANVPEVVTLQLPPDAEKFLRHVWAFDRPAAATGEDRVRADFYQQNRARDEVRTAALSLDDFLAKLELQIEIRAIQPADFRRVSQLTQRTTQFNCSTNRRTEAELAELLANGELTGRIARVKDRFGDYGDVGITLLACAQEELRVDTFLLSCRALGRGVEEKMLRDAASVAKENRLERVEVLFIPSARNEPALKFLQAAPASNKRQEKDGVIYSFDAKRLLASEERFATKHESVGPEIKAKTSTPGSRVNYQRIATELSDLEKLSAAMDEFTQRDFDVETILRAHPDIRDVVVNSYVRDGKRLAVYAVVEPKRAPRISGRMRTTLANGISVVEQSRVETETLYHEMFAQRIYFQHGISLRDGECVIDAGANIGMFTIFASLTWPNARVYSFEPVPPMFELLRINTRLHAPNAKIFNIGVSDKTGRATIEFHPHLSGASSFFEADVNVTDSRTIIERQLKGCVEARKLADYTAELTQRAGISERHEVATISLSDFFQQEDITHVGLLKVDVEKSEMNLLRGITHADWAMIDQVVLEAHTNGLRDECAAFLQERGFNVIKDQAPERVGTGLSYLYARKNSRQLDTMPTPRTTFPSLLNANDLRAFVKSKTATPLPPLDFIFLDEMPANLQEPSPGNGDFDHTLTKPENPIQEQIAELWKPLLDLEDVGIYENFFDLGGHSLLATALLSRMHESFGIELPLATIFEAPTVAALSERVENELIAQLDESEIRDVLATVEQ